MSEKCQTVSDKLLISCRTLLTHNIILQIDIHCQTVSDKLSNSVRQFVNQLQTVAEQVYHKIFIC